jgi:hypothetical protein
MGEVINDSALQNSSKATNSKANSQSCLQTQSLASPVKGVYWTDKNGVLLLGYAPYGSTITLNIETQIPGIDIYVIVYKPSGLSLKKDSFRSEITNKVHKIEIDTLSNSEIYGDTNILGSVSYSGTAPLFIDKKSNRIEVPTITMDIIPYIPKIMKAKGWAHAENALNIWLTNEYAGAKKATDIAILGIIDMKWARSFSYIEKRIKDKFTGTKEDLPLSSENSKKEIIGVIKDQVTDNIIKLPINVGDEVLLGNKDKVISKNREGESVPVFDKYRFDHIRSDIPILFKSIDEFIAAVNECDIRFIAIGRVRKENENLFTVFVEKVGVYIFDSFDTEDSKGSKGSKGYFRATIKESVVSLGYWDVKGNNVGWFPRGGETWTHVTNDMFRKWRERNKKGQDYLSFSDIDEVDFNLKFKFDDQYQLVP